MRYGSSSTRAERWLFPAPLLELGAILVLTVLGSAARRWALAHPAVPADGSVPGQQRLAPVDAAVEFCRDRRVDRGGCCCSPSDWVLRGGVLRVAATSPSLGRSRSRPQRGSRALAGWLLGLEAVGIVAPRGITYISSSGVIAWLLGDLNRLATGKLRRAVGPWSPRTSQWRPTCRC